MLVGLLSVGLALRGLPALDNRLLDRLVLGHGLSGDAAYLGLASIGCALGVPRQATAFAAGYAFSTRLGLAGAVALSLAAQLLGCAANFLWARWLGRVWIQRRLPPSLMRFDTRLRRHPFRATLTLRLFPLGSNVALNIIGGVSTVAMPPFMAASVIGYLPQTFVFTLLGRGTHVGRWAELALAVGLFALSIAPGARLLGKRSPPGVSEG